MTETDVGYGTMNEAHDPLQEIPKEIVSKIFEFTLEYIKDGDGDGDDAADDGWVRPYVTSPLFLGAVCGLWRAIAWSTPRLWTNISLVLELSADRGHYLTSNRITLLKEYIQRSHALPLDICISCFIYPRDLFDFPKIDSKSFMDSLNKSSPRWRRIDLALPTEFFTQLSVLPSPNPILQSLEIRSTTGTMPFLDLTRFSANLRYIKLHSDMHLVKVSRGKLKCIEDASGDQAHCREVLFESPLLEQASIELDLEINDSEPLRLLSHPSLKILSLSSEYRSPDAFLACLTLPSLKDISTGGKHLEPHMLLDLIERSGCTLTRLELSRVSWSAQRLGAVLLHLPYLQRLNLLEMSAQSRMEVFHTTFSTIQRGDSRLTPILPDLEEFVFQGPWTPEDRWPLILNTIGALPSTSPSSNQLTCRSPKFRKLMVKFRAFNGNTIIPQELLYLDNDTLDLVQRLKREGVNIELINQTNSGKDLVPLSILHRQHQQSETSFST